MNFATKKSDFSGWIESAGNVQNDKNYSHGTKMGEVLQWAFAERNSIATYPHQEAYQKNKLTLEYILLSKINDRPRSKERKM